MRWFVCVLGVAVLGLPAAAHASVRIEAQCGVLQGCTFTNVGDEAGSGCARLVIRSRTGRTWRSGSVCSGRLEPNTTSAPVPVGFPGENPLAACRTEDDCQPTVEVENLQSNSNAWMYWLAGLLLSVFSAAWAHSDATRRRMDDPSPSAWAVRCFFLWPVFLPMYLTRRGAHPVRRKRRRRRELATDLDDQ